MYLYRFYAKYVPIALILISVLLPLQQVRSQINTDRVMSIGKNALYFEDYVLAMQYFNVVIGAKPYLAEPYFCRAVAKINLEDYVGADADCSLALERNPFIVNAYHCRGVARLNIGKYEDALADFVKGLELDEYNSALMTCKGIAYVQMKKYDDAKRSFSEAIGNTTRKCPIYIYRAKANILAGDTVSALEDVEKSLALDKYDADAYAFRGMIRYLKKDYKDAVSDYDEALRLVGKRADLFVNRGIARYELNDLQGAMTDYDAVVALDEDNVVARFNRGLLRMEVGNWNGAEEDFAHVILVEPDNDMAIYNRGIIRSHIGNYKGAIEDFTNIINEYPDFAQGYYARAEAKRRRLDEKGARLDYNTAYVLEHKQKEEKQDSLKTRKKKDKSIKKYNRLIAADPEDEEKRVAYKTNYRGKVQNVNAEITLQPNYVPSYYADKKEVGGVAYSLFVKHIEQTYKLPRQLYLVTNTEKLSEGQVQQHFESIKRVEKSGGWTDKNKLLARALDYASVQDYAAAYDDLTAYIQIDKNEPFVYFFIAEMLVMKYKALGDGDENAMMKSAILKLAIDNYEQCERLSPDFAYCYYNEANVRVMLKDYPEAIVKYTKALTLSPDLAEAYFNRGLTFIYTNRNEDGISDLSKAGEKGIYSAYNVIKRYSENKK
ncbi:MAG: tetratricopeptide repeat protein [Paludibacteraceae bacterium]|nr:tetratricopeptide repeat protein [Paludibacteraceae bacterium]